MKKKFICTVCGYVYEGEEAPAKCPLCGAPASKFKEITEDNTPEFATVHELGRAYTDKVSEDIVAHCKNTFAGECTEVGMYLAMSRQAQLYLLDEPIGGVDPAARDYILNTIISNYNENGTVIISTHLIADVEQVLDDVIFIKDGSIAACTSVDEIREKEGESVDEYFREVFRC